MILVDMDLRSPSVATMLDLDAGVGVTSVALGRASLDEALVRIPLEQRDESLKGSAMAQQGVLEVLPTGALPPDASEFVASPSMTRLLAQLNERADLLVIDTPPILPVSDALALSPRVDAVVVITRLGEIRRSALSELARLLEAAPIVKLGFIVTGVGSDEDQAYGGYGYGYGYGYGDAYGDGASAGRKAPAWIPRRIRRRLRKRRRRESRRPSPVQASPLEGAVPTPPLEIPHIEPEPVQEASPDIAARAPKWVRCRASCSRSFRRGHIASLLATFGRPAQVKSASTGAAGTSGEEAPPTEPRPIQEPLEALSAPPSVNGDDGQRHDLALRTLNRAKIKRALELFNRSEHAGEIAGVARSVAPPKANAHVWDSASAEVMLTVAWQGVWYQFVIDLSDTEEAVRMWSTGHELEKLPARFKEWNVLAQSNGTLKLRRSVSRGATTRAPKSPLWPSGPGELS